LGPIGFPELLFILVLALLIFGPRRIPEIGRTLGKAMGEFRRATTDFKRTLNLEAALDEDPVRKPPPPVAPPAQARPVVSDSATGESAAAPTAPGAPAPEPATPGLAPPELAAASAADAADETVEGEDPPTQPIEPVQSPAGTEPRS
jgi:sec-independent protein translocase protein TatB